MIRQAVFRCALLLALVLPIWAFAGDRPSGQVPAADSGDAVPMSLSTASQQSAQGCRSSEPLMSVQGSAEPALAGINDGPSLRCQFQTCLVSISCFEGCEQQWCNPWWNCDDENLCWCVRSCAEICV